MGKTGFWVDMNRHSENTPGPKHQAAPNEILQVRIPNDPTTTTYYTRVMSISGGVLTVPWPTDRGIRLIARKGDCLDFYFIRGGIPHVFSGIVDKTDPTGPLPQITIITVDPARKIQRRQNCRVKCMLPIEVVSTIREDPSDPSSPMLVLRTVTSDISAGGISFRHAKQLPPGAQLNLTLTIPDGRQPINIPCVVIYSEYFSEHQLLYRTAVRFIALGESDRARIVRFIYRTQLKGVRS